MKLSKASGVTIAAAAAALLVGGSTLAPTAQAQEKVQCFGVNACKGQSACKTANSSCKGQNECKGQGFMQLTKAECDEKGGSTTDPNA